MVNTWSKQNLRFWDSHVVCLRSVSYSLRATAKSGEISESRSDLLECRWLYRRNVFICLVWRAPREKKKKFIYITWSTEIMRNVNLALCLPGGFSSPQRGAIFTSAGYLIKKNMWLDWNHRARKNQPNLSKVMSFVTLQTWKSGHPPGPATTHHRHHWSPCRVTALKPNGICCKRQHKAH